MLTIKIIALSFSSTSMKIIGQKIFFSEKNGENNDFKPKKKRQ